MNIVFVVICVVLLSISSQVSGAQIFRDIEIEEVIKKISAPLFGAANVDVSAIKVFVVDDDSINAYVSYNHIFIHKGLLVFSKDPGAVAGVIAHEIGHMFHNHIVKREGERMKGMVIGGLSYVLGMITSIIVDPRVGQAIVSGGSAVGYGNFMAYSRSQEEVADQCALEYLDMAGYSKDGLLDVLRHFNKNEIYNTDADKYMVSHPFSEQRLKRIHNYKERREPIGFLNEDRAMFSRVVEKVEAFMTPIDTLRSKELSTYMKSILNYREGRSEQALNDLGILISMSPTDPYLLEVRAQILYKLGKIDASIRDYEMALRELPGNILMELELAQVLTLKDPNSALRHLEKILLRERNDPHVWRQLALVYGKIDKIDMTYFALANSFFLEGNSKMFMRYVKLSKQHLRKDSIHLKKILDLEEAAA
ncbi:M48 family metalloprotease [Anaplasma bovis]|uniref:M48 family metalloprotease n=1 Tax=Anaplasma bovis TaxID=186733 RepID=UPI002FF0C1C6